MVKDASGSASVVQDANYERAQSNMQRSTRSKPTNQLEDRDDEPHGATDVPEDNRFNIFDDFFPEPHVVSTARHVNLGSETVSLAFT